MPGCCSVVFYWIVLLHGPITHCSYDSQVQRPIDSTTNWSYAAFVLRIGAKMHYQYLCVWYFPSIYLFSLSESTTISLYANYIRDACFIWRVQISSRLQYILLHIHDKLVNQMAVYGQIIGSGTCGRGTYGPCITMAPICRTNRPIGLLLQRL